MGGFHGACSSSQVIAPVNISPPLNANNSEGNQPLLKSQAIKVPSDQFIKNETFINPLEKVVIDSQNIEQRSNERFLLLKQKKDLYSVNQLSHLGTEKQEKPIISAQLKLSPKPIIRNNNFQSQNLQNKIISNFTIGKQLVNIFDGVSFTHNQAKDLSKTLIKAIKVLQQSQDLHEKQVLNKLLTEENIHLIKSGELLYYQLLDKVENSLQDRLKKMTQEQKQVQVSQLSKSRIYHTIANLNKKEEVQAEIKNQYGVYCKNCNDYQILSESELEQVALYESIAEKTKQIGKNIGFRYKSIKEESEKINSFLVKCIQRHMNDIKGLQYNLSSKQVMKMAEISRQACIYYDNGIYVLVLYFVQSCRRLQQQSKTPSYIEKQLQTAIDQIYKKYPPAKGLSIEHEELLKKLKELETIGFTKVEFKHEAIDLECQDRDKQKKVEEIIINYAKIAQQCKETFEELVKATCLEKCLSFKIGLKYYPNKPNPKAMTRIKQKMYFKKDSKGKKQISQISLRQVLEKEQLEYRKQIDRILKEKDRVEFGISDMVRGKCVFLEVADIIYTVASIKRFVANNPKYGIAEIQSRFNNPTPISDVTLKIVVDSKIIAELQLTIQTNAAAYVFSHKIYEIQRTKVFSKIKIVHNCFQELKQEFTQLVKMSLEFESTKHLISQQTIKDIQQYFNLDSVKCQPFVDILLNCIRQQRNQLNKLQICINPLLQELISVAFNIGIGKWGKDLGQIINKALKKEQLSPKLKSVVLWLFFNKFNLSAQSQKMQQFGITLKKLKEKIYMQEFMKEEFQVQRAFKYVNQNQRVSHRAKQLQLIVFYKGGQSSRILLRQTTFINNLVLEGHCSQKVQQLHELLNFHFITRKDNNLVYPLCQKFDEWLGKQIEIFGTAFQQIYYQVLTLVLQYQIEQNNQNETQKYLQSCLHYFKGIEDQQKVMQCQILLTQCKIKSQEQSLHEKNEYYQKNVIQKAQILGLELKGSFYADSLWRIENYLWENNQQEKQKVYILKTFTTRALEQMSRSKGNQFISAILKRWPEYEKNKIQKPSIKANNHIKYVKLYFTKALGCEYLTKVEWNNLTTLNITENNIGVEGCKYLCKAKLKNITILSMEHNNIEAAGCEYLSKADWKNITMLYLRANNIGAVGCQHLSKADWKNITTLDLEENNIGSQGIEHLSKAGWSSLTQLNLYGNKISDQGCKLISKPEWKNLTILYLGGNYIKAAGCEHLSKASWSNITTLYLDFNVIDDAGCQYLSKADWKNIAVLYLDRNKFGIEGCQHLSKANWQKLIQLNLEKNNLLKSSLTKLFPQKIKIWVQQ